MQLTLMQQTLQLAFRIAFAWAGGLLLAVSVRALLPDQLGFKLTAPAGTYFLPFSRIGFWTCIWAAVTVTILVVAHAMIGDLASSAAR